MRRIPHQRQRGQIVMRGRRPRKLPRRLQHAQAQIARSGGGRILKSQLRPIHPEFHIVAVPTLAVRFDKPRVTSTSAEPGTR